MLTDGNGVDITTQHAIEPEAGTLTHRYIAHDGGVIGHEDVVCDARGEYFAIPVNGLD